jgi:RNA polymerase sigma-70 factor, ECF subfamily
MSSTGELVPLLAAVSNGDKQAFERLYAATSAKLFGVTLRIVRRPDLADEVMQDTYLKVWRGAGEFDSRIATPITWMVAIARNRALDAVRKQAEVSIDDGLANMEAIADDPNALEQHEMTDELRLLLACLGALEADRRRLVLLAYYGGWSRDQLAAKFDTPVSTVKTWLRRSLIQIRECLGS